MKTLILVFIMAVPAGGAEVSVSLRSAEEGALASSNQYKSARLSAQAADAAARSAGASIYPRLSLENTLRYNSVVSEMKLPAAMGGPRKLGDNWIYSAGPSASWTVFDGGVLR